MKRLDGRKPEELRPLEIRTGVIKNADGSSMVRMGRTVAVAAVYGPREYLPKHKQLSNRGVLRCIYSMAPFSTDERVRPGPSRRSQEISLVTTSALQPAVFLEEFPKTVIDVFITIIQADAGTRCAGINAASAALADAGIPMRDLVAAVAAGKIDGHHVLDLAGKEEELTDADIPVACMPRSGKITLLQMDGDMPPEDVKEAIKLALRGCGQIYEAQREALKERWRR